MSGCVHPDCTVAVCCYPEAGVDGCHGRVLVVPVEAFAAEDEPGPPPVLGDSDDDAVFPASGDSMFYGDGGAGKSTLAVDLAVHLAAGTNWLGIQVLQPVRVMLLENEGPRRMFRRKLARKLAAWEGPQLDGRLHVWQSPWGKSGFGTDEQRQQLAASIAEHQIDVLIAGPVTRLGMDEAGTLQHVRDFTLLVGLVREMSRRQLHVSLIHHENRAGAVSGAWEGAVDTLIHVQAQGHGKTRVYFQKARHSSERHKTTLNLLWADGDSFAVEEREELDDNTLADLILDHVRRNPGVGWTNTEEATPGANRQRRRTVRDRLLAAGRIVTVVKIDGEETALDHVLERKQSRLYVADDPTIAHLLPVSGADGAQIAPTTGEAPQLHLRPAPRPLGAQGVGAAGSPAGTVGASPLFEDAS